MAIGLYGIQLPYNASNYKYQDFIDNTQTHKCVTWGHNIYTVLHGEMIIYYQKH
jgi:hypothetical protein